MVSLLARKKLVLLAVERLEDRCVPSDLGPPPIRDGSPPAIEDPARMTPIAEASTWAPSGVVSSSVGPADTSRFPGAAGLQRAGEPSQSLPWAADSPVTQSATTKAQDEGPAEWAGLAPGSGASFSSMASFAPASMTAATSAINRTAAAWPEGFADPAGAGQGLAGGVVLASGSSIWSPAASRTTSGDSIGRPVAAPTDPAPEAGRLDSGVAVATPPAVAPGAASAGRSLFLPPVARSNDVASTGRAEVEASSEAVVLASPAGSPSILPGSVPAAGAGPVSFEIPPRGAATPPVVVGWDSPDGPARPAFDAGVKGGPDPRTPIVPPEAPGWRTGEAESAPGDDGLASASTEQGTGTLDPQLADVITSLVPFGRASIGDAIDQLFEPFDGLDPSRAIIRWSGPMGLVTASLAVAGSVLAVEVALRLRRSRGQEGEAEGGPGLARIPGLPGFRGWSRP